MVTGSLLELRADADFSGATCLADAVDDSPFVDPRADPEVGEGNYYLIRAVNACGTATYGSSGNDPDPREHLNQQSPCP